MTLSSSHADRQTPDSPGSRRVPRWFKWGLVGVGGLTLLAGLLVGGVEYYTGRSEFCGSCHAMAPHYASWRRDKHATKAGAACVDCHYAPGERYTANAKLRGLSQWMSCYSGRTGTARRRPGVQDASCLREGCHVLADIADRVYPVGSAGFVHSRHLNRGKAAGAKSGRAELTPEALRQVDDLRCTTCHAGNGDGRHFGTNRSLCYLCHFAGPSAGADTARCLGCHAPSALASGKTDHSAIVAGNVGCAGCHADPVAGTAKVARGRCVACHDLPRYREAFDCGVNAETVRMLHAAHTPKRHATCTECHEEFRHPASSAGTTQEVRPAADTDQEQIDPADQE